MKKSSFTFKSFLFLSLMYGTQVFAQTPATSSIDLDINMIRAAHMTDGNLWNNIVTGTPAMEYPKGTNKHASYASGLWIGGYDASLQLKGAASTFRSAGVDFYPGPLDNATGACSAASSAEWDRFWKIDASTIGNFRKLYASGGVGAITDPKYNVIKEWPAKGNIYAKGAKGNPLPELLGTASFAPFVDENADGIYNWQDGDYPKIKGDQMLWWVFNDNTGIHKLSKTTAMGLEIRASAYGYNRGSSVDRMLFYEFDILNKGASALDSFVLGLFSDADLGNPIDDALAVDSAHRMIIEFNPNADLPNGMNSYGANPPLAGVSFIEMPGDIYPASMQKVGAYAYFMNSGTGPYRDPSNMKEFYYYMTGNNADGLPIEYAPGGITVLHDVNGVTACSPTPASDKRYIISNKAIYGFNPGTSKKYAMAFLVTDTNSHICPTLNFKEITDLADTAWKVYYNPLPLSAKEVSLAAGSLKIHPNPAHSVLYVSVPQTANKKEKIRVIDALGKTIILPTVRNSNEFEINIGALASGVYSIIYNDGETTISQAFVKQ